MSLATSAAPLTVAYCHCADCRRVTGAPVAAFAAFSTSAVRLDPDTGTARPVTQGVTRRFCRDCGSALTAEFDYLPGQVYVPLGILDQADLLEPDQHCHEAARLAWLHIKDRLPRDAASGRARLNALSTAADPCG